jgi:hypothetical protein
VRSRTDAVGGRAQHAPVKHPDSHARAVRRRPLSTGSTVVSALAVVGLFTAFYRVVSTSVADGEARRRAVAAHTEGEWRCKAERERLVRTECLLQLNMPRHAAGLVARGAVAPS